MTRGVEQKKKRKGKYFTGTNEKTKEYKRPLQKSTVLCVPLAPDHFTLHYAQPNILLFLWCSQCNFCGGLNKIFELHWFCWDNAESSSLRESDALHFSFFFIPISSSSFYIFFSFQVKCHFFVSGHKKLQKKNKHWKIKRE